MPQTDAGQVRSPARVQRIRRLKRLIIMVPLSTILILMILCIFLGIRLHMVKKELREAQAVIDRVSVMNQTDAGADGIRSGEEASGGGDALYTVSEVDMFTGKAETAEDTVKDEDGIRKVYLTFDDGPSSNTGRILDILADYDVKATFFVVGKEKEEYRPLYKRIVDEGHTLAMHSYSHKYDEIYQSLESYSADLRKLQEFLYDVTGVWCRYCRFPGGSSNTVSRVDMHELIAYLDDQDMSYFDWNISSGDAASTYISSADILRNCTVNLEKYDEAIILMHDASDKNSTVEALPKLIETIQSMEDTKIVPITDDTEPIHHISND